MTTTRVTETAEETFAEDVLRSDLPVLAVFTAKHCAPCRQLAPVLESLAGDLPDRLRVVRIDVNANPGLTRDQEVMGTPTMLLFRGGEPVRKMVGALPKRRILQEIERLS
ncbi:thioredoxin family protein [Nocardiopsis sp. EMB25]|uniref:thioredoxin family protein n=1 Tax=Nocardiopsis sp. EMB25 TaxID=2835867 RepID=UPI0022852725|nr:thioredoxin domain-containing protein [Nocardiopsis sp. EMB25]MCY9785545.1 thioredoxin family protein [Nocardiopsis sp. EMB25]